MTEDYVTIVSGLPRSGTSLMMQMLLAGGLQPLTDGRRAPDEHNPRGYFECEGVKHSRTDVSWLEQAGGKAVKVIHLLLLHLPADRNYRVIFMRRNLEEVVASQRAMLKYQGLASAALDDVKLAGIFARQLGMVGQWLAERPHFRVLYVNHNDIIGQPVVTAEKVNQFLGGDLPVASMVGAVNPSLYRQRKSIP
jgi:hypothetical protein